MELSFRVRERKIAEYGGEGTRVHEALRNINEEIVKYLSRHEVSVKATAENKTTPLHWAVSVGYKGIVKILLDKKANIDASDMDESIPLYVAEQHPGFDNLDLLADLEKKGRESSPLNYGKQDRYHWLLMDDVGYIADVNAKDEHERTPLHIALRERGKEGFFWSLISGDGVDDSAVDRDGSARIPVPHEKISTLLLEYGANVNARDVNGTTPLHIAATTRCFWISSQLLENGADVNARDKHGKTPMHYAVAQEKICNKTVEILLDAESDVNILDNQGCTPISICFDKYDLYKPSTHYRGNVCEVNHWYRPIVRLFGLHTFKLRAAGLYVDKKNLRHLRKEGFRPDCETREWIQNFNRELLRRLWDCDCELKKMKSKKLGAKVSLYDILITNNSRLINQAHPTTFAEAFRLFLWIRTEFPIYRDMLSNKFKWSRKRLPLLVDGKRSFSSLSGTILPDEMLEKIFSHLSNQDLQNLISSVANQQTK